MPELNYWAILVAALSSMVIGSLWYGPLFGRVWMEGMGWDTSPEGMKKMMEQGKKQMPLLYGQQFVLSLLMAWVLSHVVWDFFTAEPTYADWWCAMAMGFLLWLGFILPVVYGTSLWGGRKLKYVAVDLGYWLVLLLVMGLIIGAWR